MRPTPSSSALLLRCADAAGYGAVSYLDEEPAAQTAKNGLGYWRAFLSLFFVII